MRPWRRWAIAGAGAASVTLAASGAPLGLRHMDAFRIRHVRVTGTEHLSTVDAVVASGITSTSSVFDDFEPWREALERQPLVLSAEISRRLPDTIVLAIIESTPIAVVEARKKKAVKAKVSVAVDARGRVLPIETAGLEREVPVLRADVTADDVGMRLDASGVRAVRALADIREAEPWLAAWTSEIGTRPDGVRLTLRWPAGAEVLLSETDADVLEAVRLTVLDLAGSAKTAAGDADAVAATATVVAALPYGAEPPGPALAATQLERLSRVDARFRDQVVVTLHEADDTSREERAR